MDIEGTTTSISFVADVLFPFFIDNIELVRHHLENHFIREHIEWVKVTAKNEENKVINDNEAIDYLIHWTKTDRKHPALKAIQGWVWKTGYTNGQLKGHLYSEVKAELDDWYNKGIGLGIYSSGSVAAQKLLFSNSVEGDLTYLFSHYFDTGVGHKREVDSYIHIQKAINIPAKEILFLSDVEQELDAAKAAGMDTIQLVRPGTKKSLKHDNVVDFSQIKV